MRIVFRIARVGTENPDLKMRPEPGRVEKPGKFKHAEGMTAKITGTGNPGADLPVSNNTRTARWTAELYDFPEEDMAPGDAPARQKRFKCYTCRTCGSIPSCIKKQGNMNIVKRMSITLVLSLAFSTILFAGTRSDIGKEQRWAEQIIDTLFDGETVWLDAKGHEFLAIEMETSGDDTGRAAIVVHGIGAHPNWEQVVRPLRVRLPEHGWHTLSIQMPILLNDAESHEYAPLLDEVSDRINAAIRYLKERGQEEIAIVAHSMGAAMTMRYVEDVPEASVLGLVLIGMQGGTETVHDNAATLEKVRLPVLDLYGSDDLPGVVDFTGRKANAARQAGNDAFQQTRVEGANHFFDDLEDELVEVVAGWLEKTAS